MSAYTATFGGLLVSGLLGSAGHCLGMCGPLVVMLGIQFRDSQRAVLPSFLLYHAVRVMIYVFLGLVVGAIGSLVGLAGQLSSAGGIASLLLGLGVVLFGLTYLGWLPLGRIEGTGSWVSRVMSAWLKRHGFTGVALLGALNGLLPCGLVYSALLLSASTGGAFPAALGMLFFGMGTIPALLITGMGASRLSVSVRQAMTRVAGVLMILLGIQLGLRGSAALGLVPHLHLGRFVLW
jgi:sulfite exporter TauE/SafE